MAADTPAVAETTPAPPAETTPPAETAVTETASKPPEPVKAEPGPSQKEKNRQAFAERAKRRSERDRQRADEVQRAADARVQEALSRVEAAEKARADLESKIAYYKKDPIVAAAKDGGDVEASIKSFITETGPEKLIRAQNERIEAQAEELRQVRKSMEERERQAAARNINMAIDNVAQAITSNEEKYPHVNYMYTPAQIRAQVVSVHEWGQKNGKAYSAAEVHDYLEHIAKLAYERGDPDAERRERLRARLKGTTPAQPAEIAPKGQTPRQQAPETRKLAAPTTRTPTVADTRRSRRIARAQEEAADLAILKAAGDKDRASTNGTARPKP